MAQRRGFLGWLIVVVALALTTHSAHAQGADAAAIDDADSVPESAEDAEMAASLADEEARANFEAGRLAFAGARYDDALAYFERAHVLSGRHQLLYNIGLCQDRLGRDVDALSSFERYLDAAPDAHNRAEVEQRIETARVRLERAAAAAPTPEPVPPPATDPAPWALVGSGAGVAVLGAVLLTVGRLDIGAIEATPSGTRAWSEVSGDVERADALTIAGSVALGVGVAVAVTGVAWAVAGSSSAGGGRDAPASPAVAVGIGVGTLTISGAF